MRSHFQWLFVATVLVVFPLSGGTAEPALLLAFKSGDMAAAQHELDSGADVNVADERGITALMNATRYASTREMKWLLDRGANPNARSKLKFSAFNFAVTDLAKAELLIDHGFDFKSGGEDFSSALRIAARHPRGFEVASLLVKRGADVNDGGPGATPLQRAVKSGNLRTVKLLVEHGAQVHDTAGRSLFFSAVLTGNEEIARFLMQSGADLNLSDGFAGHSLSAALANGNIDLAKELVEHGADIDQARNVGEVPPIVYAAHNESGDATMVKFLLAKGADLNAHNDRDETALSWARKRGETELVRFLREKIGKTEKAEDIRREGQSQTNTLIQVRDSHEEGAALKRIAVTKALALLQKGSEGFLDRQGRPDNCVSCHHQSLPGIVFGSAAPRSLPVDSAFIERQIDAQNKYWRKGLRSAWEYEDPVGGAVANLSHGLLNLAANHYPADDYTEAMSFFLANAQLADGGWATFAGRPPAESTRLAASALALRALQSYHSPESKLLAVETERRETSARKFFLEARAVTTEERTFKLLGLFWSKASVDAIRQAARALLESQRPDGSWAQIPTLRSDAYATGESLTALMVTRQLKPGDSAYDRGLEFLLGTQLPDGSWFVRTRTWPFQTHFNTGFPHGRDQWISASATAWATMAIMASLRPEIPLEL